LDVEYNFSNKVVLITGGTGALGSTLVKKFIDSGAITISSFVNDEGAKRLKTANHKLNLSNWISQKKNRYSKLYHTGSKIWYDRHPGKLGRRLSGRKTNDGIGRN
jgi:NAD(P)-dependent dehydrogenase (short-subunit alcohol dehydrogenase family)